MRLTFLKGVLLGTVVSTSMVMATAAFAGVGVGRVFRMGQSNNVDAVTSLVGSTDGQQLHITNTSGSLSSSGIGITVHSGRPPFAINSATKVTHLNADRLDGKDSTSFAGADRVVFNVGVAQSIAPHECIAVFAFGVGAAADAGKIVSMYITDASGTAPPPSINNLTIFEPGTVFKTSQGGTIGFARVCNPTDIAKDLPAGWQAKTRVI